MATSVSSAVATQDSAGSFVSLVLTGNSDE